MKNKLFPVSVAAAALAGAAWYLRSKKLSGKKSSSGAASKSEAVPAAPKNVKEGSYSFISGFQDAATVEMKLSYDADRFSFLVVEDGFLSESGDSHVGILSGEDFSAQFEYAGFYRGESFDQLHEELQTKHRDICPVAYGANTGLKFLAGDNICLVFPIPQDTYSYLLVTLVKAKENDDPIEQIPDYADLKYVLGSMSFCRS